MALGVLNPIVILKYDSLFQKNHKLFKFTQLSVYYLRVRTMAATRIIPVRVSCSQYDQIRGHASSSGFKSVSEFIRTRILDRDLPLLAKLGQLEESMDKIQELFEREKLK